MPEGIYPVRRTHVDRSAIDPERKFQRLRVRTMWTGRRLKDLARRGDAAAASADPGPPPVELRKAAIDH